MKKFNITRNYRMQVKNHKACFLLNELANIKKK